MKLNQLSRVEDATGILYSVLTELNGFDVYPAQVLAQLIGSFISEEEFGEIERYYAGID